MYTLESNRRASAFRAGRQGNAITTIIIHWWGNPAGNPTFDSIVTYFQNGGNKTSAHYVVEAKRVAQMVSDSDTSYAAGDWFMNLQSINIECNPRATDADKATVAELVLNLRAKYGNLRLIGHRDVVSTDCPGTYYPPNVTLAPWLNPQNPVTPQLTSKDKEMSGFFKLKQDPNNPETNKVYHSNGITATHVDNPTTLADMHFLGYQGMYSIADPISDYEVINGVPVRIIRDLTVLGKVL